MTVCAVRREIVLGVKRLRKHAGKWSPKWSSTPQLFAFLSFLNCRILAGPKQTRTQEVASVRIIAFHHHPLSTQLHVCCQELRFIPTSRNSQVAPTPGNDLHHPGEGAVARRLPWEPLFPASTPALNPFFTTN
ncbi:uncharacterized protein LOC117286870 isoform X2 [Fukomys damarensis]|uniref:uncharacterized protein LOC117286870 isoform X2 n=1 Tax=Fukomys damarensis TaxID=885580 RepID=UPI001455736A|nr:uncharacterized protein LOC117286870 isoform X2 [Fukomys damarensis]